METSREYYERVMSGYRETRGRRSLRKYCQDEGIDYQWLMKSRKEFSAQVQPDEEHSLPGTAEHFIPLEVAEPQPMESQSGEWRISHLVLSGPHGDITINAGTTASVMDLLHLLSQEERP